MSEQCEQWDMVVIGSGPAGQKAAIAAAKAGKRVCIVEREIGVGGACVHRGTIPSKTLRETAVHISGMRSRVGKHVKVDLPPDLQLASLMDRMQSVVNSHVRFQSRQMMRNGVDHVHGRGRFVDAHTIEVEGVLGETRRLQAGIIMIATGSRPRMPPGIDVDHEHIYDSDSILSMAYLPKSLTVLGGGVIASEYATIFAALGVEVTMIDRGVRPLSFVDAEILDRFVTSFEAREGCTFLGRAQFESVQWDGVGQVVTRLENGWEIKSEKLLCALGRVANVEHLNIEAAGLKVNARGCIDVDDDCRTATPHIFAMGDVIGPPSLASASMEQGRRAARAALSLPAENDFDMIPSGVYTIPEIATIGRSEADMKRDGRECLVGRAKFEELARAQISGCKEGMMKLIVDPDNMQIVGCQVVGEGATELVHMAEMAMIGGLEVQVFIERIFNFPTMAEAYRVAALDVVNQAGVRNPVTSA